MNYNSEKRNLKMKSDLEAATKPYPHQNQHLELFEQEQYPSCTLQQQQKHGRCYNLSNASSLHHLIHPRTCKSLVQLLLLLLVVMLLQPVAAGSCREAQLCCNGRDSSCVVQKAPINAIIEDLSDKPCYCDHACLKLGDCCDDFKDHCGVLDCRVSDWGQWSDCDKSCGTGMMSRARQVLQAAQNGGKHCPSLVQKRGCQGFRCHGHRDRKILREMALLLPAALSRNRHANDSNDIRRNLRTRYRDSYKHNREHEYCVEFEVLKSSKACYKLPPYNRMLEGDRITVRCDLEALIQDSAVPSATTNANAHSSSRNRVLSKHKHTARFTTTAATTTTSMTAGNSTDYRKSIITDNSAISSDDDNDDGDGDGDDDRSNNDDDDDGEEPVKRSDDDDADADQDEENIVDGSNENYDYERKSPPTTTPTTTTNRTPTSAAAAATPLSYHCRGEGLPGRSTRWSALAAPSCRGKWLRLTVGLPKKCTHAQFIFV